MKRITKKQSNAFVTDAVATLIEMGGIRSEDNRAKSSYVELSLETLVGKLNIKIEKENVYTFTIFSRFVDVQKAKFLVDCNPYSGKYNLHKGDGNTKLKSLNEMVRDHFMCLLPNTNLIPKKL